MQIKELRAVTRPILNIQIINNEQEDGNDEYHGVSRVLLSDKGLGIINS